MAAQKLEVASWKRFLLTHLTLYLFLMLGQCAEAKDEAYRNGRNLVLESFLPVNFARVVPEPARDREKRDTEGSGDGEPISSNFNENIVEGDDIVNLTQNAFTKLIAEGETTFSNLTNLEGSGEVEDWSNLTSVEGSELLDVFRNSTNVGESDHAENTTESRYAGENKAKENWNNSTSLEENEHVDSQDWVNSTDVYESGHSEVLSSSTNIEGNGPAENWSNSSDVEERDYWEVLSNSTGLGEEGHAEWSNSTNIEGSGQVEDSSEEDRSRNIPILEDSEESITTETSTSHEKVTEEAVNTEMIFDKSEDVSEKQIEQTTKINEEIFDEDEGIKKHAEDDQLTENYYNFTGETFGESTTEKANAFTTNIPDEATTVSQTTSASVVVMETVAETVAPDTQTTLPSDPPIASPEPTMSPKIIISQEFITSPKTHTETTPTSTQGLPNNVKPLMTTPEPVIEEVFKEVKTIHKDLEATPGNILRKENLTLGADPLLIVNTRIMDSEENVGLSSSKPKRLGAYIVIGFILLSFSSLVGYITFRKRLNRKRQEFEINQESHDTDKALLSLSDYKDNADSEENHLKNNEITPIVVKSNSQINRFEKNTNFSSPKNLNTIANEKNIEKDNVLKSTAENIIEDSLKVMEEDKNAPCMEKLIVKTIIDQDSIPKKPIIINRTSAGYMPIPQDYS